MARFFESNIIQPQSEYVEPPWKLMQQKLGQLQDKQDQYKQSIDLLGKPMEHLVNDTNMANGLKNTVNSKLDELSKMDINNVQSKDQIHNTIMDVRNIYETQGKLMGDKLGQYQELMKGIQEQGKKDPTVASYRGAVAEDNNMDPKKGITQDPNGNYINTQVIVPENFDYTDPATNIITKLGAIAYDSYAGGVSPAKTQDDALTRYTRTQGDFRDIGKINNSLINSVTGDRNLINSARAQRFNLVYEQLKNQGYTNTTEMNKIALAEANKEDNFYQVDPNTGKPFLIDPKTGKPTTDENIGHVVWNENTILGNELKGISEGGKFDRPHATDSFERNTNLDNQREYDRQHPIINISIPVPNSERTNMFNTQEALNDQINGSKATAHEELIKLLKAHPETYHPVSGNYETLAGIIEAGQGGVNSWLKTQHLSAAETTTLNAANVQYKFAKELDNDANKYGLTDQDRKNMDIWTSQINPIGKLNNQETMDLYLIGSKISKETATLEEKKRYVNLRQKQDGSLSYTKPGSSFSRGVFSDEELKVDAVVVLTPQLLKSNNWTQDQFRDFYNTMIGIQVKKDKYLKETGNIRRTEQNGWTTIDIVNPDGSSNQKGSDILNRNLQTLMKDRGTVSGFYTTTVKSGSGANATYKTIGDIIQEEAANYGGDASKVPVGEYPAYGSNYDATNGSTRRNMFITVGKQQIPVNMDLINVEIPTAYDKNGNVTKTEVKPLSTVDDNPVAKVNIFLDGLKSQGVQEHDLSNDLTNFKYKGVADANGRIMVPDDAVYATIVQPTLNNTKETTTTDGTAPSAGTFVNNNDSEIQIKDINGKVISTLYGTDAHDFLQRVQVTDPKGLQN